MVVLGRKHTLLSLLIPKTSAFKSRSDRILQSVHTSKQRHTIFYGWWVVAAGFFILLLTGGTVFLGFTAVLEPLANEFSWSYAQISLAASLRGLEMGLLAPLVGLVVDRWGTRRLIFGGTICIGLGLILLSRVNSLSMFYGVFILVAIGMSTLTGTVILTAVVNWFRKKVAMATGIVVSGFAVGGVLVPVVAMLIDKYEWRMAMIILGLSIWVIALPLSFLVRHKPEQHGYLPYGEASPSAASDENQKSAQSTNNEIPTRKTGATGVFWRIALASMGHMLVMSALVTHVMPYLTSTGISRSASSLVAGALPLASVGGRLGFGWLGDRLDKRRLTAICFALMALGLLFFDCISTEWMWLLVPFIILFSTGWGGSVTMRAALLREYFGRGRFGKTYGFVVGVGMLGNIAGAPLAGWVFDKWGTYHGVWFALAGLAAVALVIVLTLPRRQPNIQLNEQPQEHG